jgi:hypothetical protein
MGDINIETAIAASASHPHCAVKRKPMDRFRT